MENEGLDAACIKANGWRQGCILTKGLVDELELANFLSRSSEVAGKWIVISHDCDLTNESFDREPNVELIFARILEAEELDGNKTWMKSSRLLQLTSNSLAATIELDSQRRAVIDRRKLAAHAPAQVTLEAENVLMIATWIAKRYRRAAFPDTFNLRTQRAVGKIRKKAKSKGKNVTGIYLLVSDEELKEEESYALIAIATMKKQDYYASSLREEAMEFVGTVESSLGTTPGIDVKGIELRSEADVSLEELMVLKRWDFDDLTIRDEGAAAIPNT